MYSMYDIFAYDFSGCSFVFYSEFAFNLDLCVWLFTGYVYISHLLFLCYIKKTIFHFQQTFGINLENSA